MAPAVAHANAAPPRGPVEDRRGVVMTLVTSLLFLVLSLLYGVLLMILVSFTMGGLGLLVLCLLSASTRQPRVFVAWMWRNELWLNSLVDEKPKIREPSRESSAGRSAPRGYERLPTTAPTPPQPSSTRGREVTATVMVFSVMYFLLFKSVFNVIFSIFPLLMWFLAVVQVVPSIAFEARMVIGEDSVSRVFVALATSFFAYQISVASARGNLAVSEKVQAMMFHRDSSTASRTPLLATDSFRRGGSYAGYESLLRSDFSSGQLLNDPRRREDVRGHGGGSTSPPPAPPAPPAPPGHGFAFPPMPPMAPVAPMAPVRPVAPAPPARPYQFEAPRRDSATESAYRGEPVEREIDLCGLKITIRSEPDPEPHERSSSEGFRDSWGYDGGSVRGRDRGGGRGGGRRGGGRGGRGLGHAEMLHQRAFSAGPMARPDFAGHVPEVFVRGMSSDGDSRRMSSDGPPIDGPTFGRSSSDSPPGYKHGGRKGRRLHRRGDSFDSCRPASGRLTDVDLKHAAHSRLWEALDLRPSAPQVPTESWRSEEYPMARPAEIGYPSLAGRQSAGAQHFHKTRSDNGYQTDAGYSDDSSSRGSRKLEMFATKQRLKEQARQLKEAAKQMKREYKEQLKREAGELKIRARDPDRFNRDRVRSSDDQERMRAEQARLATHRDSKGGSNMYRSASQDVNGSLRVVETRRPYQAAAVDSEEAKAEVPARNGTYLEREHETKTRDEFAQEIEKAAQEEVERQRRELELSRSRTAMRASTGNMYSTTPTSRVDSNIGSGSRGGAQLRGRRSTSNDLLVSAFARGGDDTRLMAVPFRGNRDDLVSIANAYQTGALTDEEIQAQYSRSVDFADYTTGLGQYAPIDFSTSPALVTTLETVPVYRSTTGGSIQGLSVQTSDHGYNRFTESPNNSPSNNSFMTNSFIERGPYDAWSPTNSLQDADFPSEEFQQVYRSIRYTGDDTRVLPSQASSLPHYEDVPGTRDKVHFCSYAPPSVYPSRQSFRYAVWAFFLNQRQEMREQAETADPSARQLSIATKLVMRRGALVHVTLEVPEGFRIRNEPTQGFPWEGKISHVDFDVECTDNADFGQVLFKATIVVGSEVAVLRSYVTVSSRKLEPSETEAQMLDSQLEVLAKTYQEIPYPTLELKELVGSGYFGDAYRASYNGEDVVVKTIRASEFGETNDQILKEFQHEAAILSMFGHHPCVVPFVGASTDIKFPLSLITKYLPYGSLEDNLKKPESSRDLSARQRTLMLKDAAAGLLNIHEGGFIHRDIAARNCLVDQDLRVKICDFGLCRRVNAYGGSLMKGAVGPIKYMAPESLQPPHGFSYESDSWMFGVLMWETYTASSPFENMTPLEAGMRVINGEKLPIPQGLPEELRLLIDACFHESPLERPSMAEILTTLDESAAQAQATAAKGARPQPARAPSGSSARGVENPSPGLTRESLEALASDAAALQRRNPSIWV